MAFPTEEQFTSLQLLLKAPSKDAVRQICTESFPVGASKNQSTVERTANALSVSSSEAMQLLTAFHMLSHHVVYQSLTSPEQIQSIFPESFHSNLKNLITKIILENSVAWRNEALSSQISLPKLVDLEWRVDMKTASDSLSRMAVPTCLLQMKLQDTPCISGSPSESTVTMELSKETLDTMIDGLGRIRDQLSAVARK
ncbi:COMM domain-containing protein 9 isoform X2 [Puntigrus tetrazona]|uniref:COMM domain-containing protein 9 isoform X2 n=1 Tax=Puntigrus tetrazona TaxID=1606681 RepID=UPI001C8998B7|nr:COMM domain-containing protein 9 isoform X2 [Puntigrus tetrazona]